MKREDVKAALDDALVGVKENSRLFTNVVQEGMHQRNRPGKRMVAWAALLGIIVLSVVSISFATSSHQWIINWQGEKIDDYVPHDVEHEPFSQEEEHIIAERLAQGDEKLIYTILTKSKSRSLHKPKATIDSLDELNQLIREQAPYLAEIQWIPEGYVFEKSVVTYLAGAQEKPRLLSYEEIAPGKTIIQYELSAKYAVMDSYAVIFRSLDDEKTITAGSSIVPFNLNFVIDSSTAYRQLDIPGTGHGIQIEDERGCTIELRSILDEPPMAYFSPEYQSEAFQCRVCTISAPEYLHGMEWIFTEVAQE